MASMSELLNELKQPYHNMDLLQYSSMPTVELQTKDPVGHPNSKVKNATPRDSYLSHVTADESLGWQGCSHTLAVVVSKDNASIQVFCYFNESCC